jgi:hypothetical protein
MKNNKKAIILWIKRVAALLTVIVWVAVLYNIFQSGGNFNDQAPQCIISTMLIFVVLTAVYKGLEYWEKV